MPNWCNTTWAFDGTESEIRTLHDILDKARSTNIVKNDFGKEWLGNIAYLVGINNEIDKSFECRGTLDSVGGVSIDTDSDNHAWFSIETTTAWTYDENLWSAVIKKLNLSSVIVSFFAYEPSDDICVIHDPGRFNRFTTKPYLISCNITENRTKPIIKETSCTESELIELLQHILNTDTDDINELIDTVYNMDFTGDDFISIHEIERI